MLLNQWLVGGCRQLSSHSTGTLGLSVSLKDGSATLANTWSRQLSKDTTGSVSALYFLILLFIHKQYRCSTIVVVFLSINYTKSKIKSRTLINIYKVS